MALWLAFSGALLCGISNLFMRKSLDAGGSTKGFLVFNEAFSFFIAVLLGPVRSGVYGWSNAIALTGLIAGVFLGVMMWAIGKAVEKGPPGLTIAVLNASTLVPALIMVALFGTAFGHTYQSWNAFGSLIVLIGLFWAGWQTTQGYRERKTWFLLAMIAFWCHTLFLVILQWRALLIRTDLPTSGLLPFFVDPQSAEWFMPMIFVSATLILAYVFWSRERRAPQKTEVVYGLYGGICNGACTYFLMRAAQLATPWENAVTFPLFAVSLIMVCNLWGKILYKENVHWRAMALCVGGLFVGTLNWSSIL